MVSSAADRVRAVMAGAAASAEMTGSHQGTAAAATSAAAVTRCGGGGIQGFAHPGRTDVRGNGVNTPVHACAPQV